MSAGAWAGDEFGVPVSAHPLLGAQGGAEAPLDARRSAGPRGVCRGL